MKDTAEMNKMRSVFAKKSQEVDGSTIDAIEDMIDDEPLVQRIGGRSSGGSKRSHGPPKNKLHLFNF